MVLGREGLGWRSDAINNDFPEPLSPVPSITAPLYAALSLDLDIQDLGKVNSKCTTPSFCVICTFKLTPFQSGPRRHRPHPSNITSFSVWEKGKKKKKERNLGIIFGVGLRGDRRADRTFCWESCVLSVRWPSAATTMEMSLRFEATCLLCCSFLLLITSSDGRAGLGKGQNSFLSYCRPGVPFLS